MKKKSRQKRGTEGRESLFVRQARILLWRLFTRFKCRERIAKANAWADAHRRETAAITVSSLTLLLVIGTYSSLPDGTEDWHEGNFMSGIAPVNPMFRGLQRIQDAKSYQVSQMQGLALRGKPSSMSLTPSSAFPSRPGRTLRKSSSAIGSWR